MKRIRNVTLGALVLFLGSAVPTLAIEGLQISVQCSNVVLRWPSDEFSGKTYIVQYRPDLVSTNPWITLTNFMPPDSGTNVTFFIHSNVVLHPNCNDQGGGSMSAMMLGESVGIVSDYTAALASISAASEKALTELPENWYPTTPTQAVLAGRDSYFVMPPPMPPTRVKTNGVWTLLNYEDIYGPLLPTEMKIPLRIRQKILVSLAEEEQSALLTGLQVNYAQELNPSQPSGESGDSGGGTDFTPETGFYRVVEDGVKILDSSMAKLTNGLLSGFVDIRIEAGNALNDGTGTNVFGTIENAALIVDGMRYRGEGIIGAPQSSFYP